MGRPTISRHKSGHSISTSESSSSAERMTVANVSAFTPKRMTPMAYQKNVPPALKQQLSPRKMHPLGA